MNGKLIFDKLVTPAETVKVSYDGGASYSEYTKATAKEGIVFSEEQCSDLTQIRVQGKVKQFDDISVEIVPSVATSGCTFTVDPIDGEKGVFSIKNSLSSIELPSGVTKLQKGCFEGMQGLQAVSLPETVIAIGNDAFYNCKNLSYIQFPSNLQEIGSYSFAYSALKKNKYTWKC